MLDIRGGLKNTKISRNPYAVLEELASNSIESFLIRKHAQPETGDFKLQISIKLYQSNLLSDETDLSISITDNGAGFEDRAIRAFVTKDTTYKDDLEIPGIERCKGSGRIQFFHVFEHLDIDSVVENDSGKVRQTLHLPEGAKTISAEDFIRQKVESPSVQTTITLSKLKPDARQSLLESGNLSEIYSASNIRKFLLATFLQRLIASSDTLGTFTIEIDTEDGPKTEKLTLKSIDLPAVTSERKFEVSESDHATGDNLGSTVTFNLSHYRLEATELNLSKNAISLCAKSTPVVDITSRYLRTKTQENNDVDGAYHIVFVESAALDKKVNEQRDGFDDLPESLPSGDLLSRSKISFQAIYEELDQIIEELVAPPDWSKDQVKLETNTDFGISEIMLTDTDVRIRYGDTAKSVAKRVLSKYQNRILNETDKIVDLFKEIESLSPDSDDFREAINSLSWAYTASIKNFDMANLSQLVVRRTAIVKALELACKKLLHVQTKTSGERRKDESLIHHIFFPMRKSSDDEVDHDIWLLSEEYQYFDYIASDRPLSSIKLPNGGKFFEPDVDDELAKLLEQRAADNERKRPDIALFSEEGAAVIVEFKAPGVSMDNHIGDLSEYSHLLGAKSGGKLKKFYCYLIGDSLNELRLSGWTEFSDGTGYFQTTELRNPKTKEVLGEMYSEILFYQDVIGKAKKRIAVYQDKLGLNPS